MYDYNNILGIKKQGLNPELNVWSGRDMGIRALETKMGVKSKPGVLHNIGNPYSHLAVSIIIQAFKDLEALDGEEQAILVSSVVGRYEILNFLRSEWRGLLLSCQSAVTQEKIESAAMAVLKNRK